MKMFHYDTLSCSREPYCIHYNLDSPGRAVLGQKYLRNSLLRPSAKSSGIQESDRLKCSVYRTQRFRNYIHPNSEHVRFVSTDHGSAHSSTTTHGQG